MKPKLYLFRPLIRPGCMLACILLLMAYTVQAQTNLVQNPSFESNTACPTNTYSLMLKMLSGTK